MEKELLEQLIAEGLSTRKIGDKIGKSQGSIKHWLRKYGLKTNYNKYNANDIKRYEQTHRNCPMCHAAKEITDFYKKNGIEYDSTYCKGCTNKQTVDRMVNFKKKCMEYKGGKCIECGYDKYYGALEFHHIDPTLKDFSLSKKKCSSFIKIKEELDKCILLCSNCHKEVEAGLITLTEAQKGM